jgi:uncharacterized protein (TIGR03000 family)
MGQLQRHGEQIIRVAFSGIPKFGVGDSLLLPPFSALPPSAVDFTKTTGLELRWKVIPFREGSVTNQPEKEAFAMRKYFLLPAVLSLAVLCMLGDNAFAQRGRGWGGGGWGGRGGWYGGYGGYGGYGRGYGWGWGGLGYGLGYGGWGGYGGYSSGYSSPYYYSDYYTTPNYSYYPSTDFYSSQTPMVNNNSAMIRVIVPDPNAQIFLDGQRTSSTGNMRVYQTPPLAGAKTFSYQIRCVFMRNGQQVTEDRTVMITPGQTTTVDFSRPQ